jgi:hypothetical protein
VEKLLEELRSYLKSSNESLKFKDLYLGDSSRMVYNIFLEDDILKVYYSYCVSLGCGCCSDIETCTEALEDFLEYLIDDDLKDFKEELEKVLIDNKV